jgi:hypothetical protein
LVTFSRNCRKLLKNREKLQQKKNKIKAKQLTRFAAAAVVAAAAALPVRRGAGPPDLSGHPSRPELGC